MKKEKEKEPEKSEKQDTAVLRKKGFEEEKKDSDDSDEVRVLHVLEQNREQTPVFY